MTNADEFSIPGLDDGVLTPVPVRKRKSRAKPSPEPSVEAAPVAEKRVTTIIDEIEGGPNYEFVGVNGKGYKIPRGVATSVPEAVVGVLEDAIAARLVERKGPNGEIIREEKPYNLIPFRIVRDKG